MAKAKFVKRVIDRNAALIQMAQQLASGSELEPVAEHLKRLQAGQERIERDLKKIIGLLGKP